MNPMTQKPCIRRSPSVDSLPYQQKGQELMVTSTGNQEVFVSTMLDLRHRQAIIPTPHRPTAIQAPEIKRSHEKEDEPISYQQQTKDHSSVIIDQLISQTINNQRDKLIGESSKHINPIQSSTECNIETQSQANNNDYEDQFDAFILNHFTPFSGKQNVLHWLDETESKFNQFKVSRQSRYDAISLLLESEAKRQYIIHRKNIQSFDDFYGFLISQFVVDRTEPPHPQLCHTMITSSLDKCLPSSHKLVDKQNQTLKCDFDNLYLSNKSSIISHNNGADFGATNMIGAVPDTNSASFRSDLSVKICDQTTNDLRRAIVSDLIKNPKIFRGSKDDVQKWMEDIEHLLDIASIPEPSRLSLISYSLRGDALQWYKTNKDIFTSWKSFVYEIKRAFTSSFHAELAFQKLEAYSQGENQSIRNFYNEVLKLCKEADSNMSDSTKLKNLLNKTKPSIQFEVRKKKPTSLAEFLEYARDVEELFQLSNINMEHTKNSNSNVTNERSFSNQNSSYSTNNSYSTNRYLTKFPFGSSRNFNNTNKTSDNSSQNRNNRDFYQSLNNPQSFSNQSRNTYSRFPTNRNNTSHRTNDNRRFSIQLNSTRSSHNNQTRTANMICPIPSLLDQEFESDQDPSSAMFCTHCEQYGHELDSCQNF